MFQSTRPVWGATFVALHIPDGRRVSIHAPRVGRDPRWALHLPCIALVSIHAPRVGRDSGQ